MTLYTCPGTDERGCPNVERQIVMVTEAPRGPWSWIVSTIAGIGSWLIVIAVIAFLM